MSDDQVLKNSEAFGKLERGADGCVLRWHPLIDHMIDVAACFHRLAHCRSIRRAMERSAGRQLTSQDISRLAVLAFLHDVGKANSGFQAKRWKDKRDIPRYWPLHAGHGVEGLKLFNPDNRLDGLMMLLPVEHMSLWGDACYRLLVASISHHGRPLVDGPAAGVEVSGKRFPTRTILLFPERNRLLRFRYLYPLAFEADGEDLPGASAFGHLFAGLVQLADWLGSDTRFFEYSGPGEARAVSAPKLADDAITTLGLNAEDWRERLTATEPDFARPLKGSLHIPFRQPWATRVLGHW
jgi:CRISPR-associated endonuclease/helicase Cas3